VQKLEVNGVQLRVWRPSAPSAAARTIVFVHGIGMSHRAFSRLAGALRGSYRLIGVDLPGFGGTRSASRTLAVEGHAEALAVALDRLGVARYTIAGQSMGTQIAVEVARMRPERVEAAVLIGPVVDDRRPGLARQLAALLVDTFGESPRMNAIVLGDYLRGLPQYRRELTPMLAYPLRERLAELRVPVLVVRGTHDPIARHDWAVRVTDAAAHGRLVEPAGPHHVQEHAPAAVARAIAQLLGDAPVGESVARVPAAAEAGAGASAVRDDIAARRRVPLVHSAAWLAGDWLYATAWQLRSLGPTTADDYRSGTRQPVVVLPGVYETWHFMRPLMDALHERGHPIYVVTQLGHNLANVPDSARLAMEVIEHESLDNVLLLAHSKGGLIGKYAMTQLDAGRRIDRMVAIATPFTGSAYARFMPVRHLRAFRATDPVLTALLRDVGVNRRITSIYGVFDEMVPAGSELPGARNIRLQIVGHFRILGDPVTREIVLDAVGDAGD
jgi:pimeloyl-ACP methyl ester carboxylesterase